MRLKRNVLFAHPVLSSENDDFHGGSFDFRVTKVTECGNGDVLIQGDFEVREETTKVALSSGALKVVVLLQCLNTYFDGAFPVGGSPFEIRIPDGKLLGLVTLRAVIAAQAKSFTIESKAVSAEFPSRSLSIAKADVVGLSGEYKFYVGLKTLAPLESIFRLVENEFAPVDAFDLELDSECIGIHVRKPLFDFFAITRGTAKRDVLLSSVYLPALIGVLVEMKDGAYADRRWHSALIERLNALGLTPQENPLIAAQKLLGMPMGALQQVFAKE